MSFGEDFIQFRTTYLRAIARAWRYPDYRQKLLDSKNAFEILKEDFGFRYEWPDLILSIRASEGLKEHPSTKKSPLSQWCPVQAGGWIGVNDEFHLNIPKSPPDPEDWSEALAAYYQQFPTLFGRYIPQDFVAKIQPMAAMAEMNSNILGGSGAGSDFLEFGAVMLRALALSWKYPARKTPPPGDLNFTEQLLQHALPTLSAWLGYNSPWNFDIYISLDTAATAQWGLPDKSTGKSADQEKQWGKLSPNTIVMYFPEAPTLSDSVKLEDRPIALTNYNSTGPQYPFTCE